MGPVADLIELGGAVAHMFVCLGRAAWPDDDEPEVGCLSNDDLDALTAER